MRASPNKHGTTKYHFIYLIEQGAGRIMADVSIIYQCLALCLSVNRFLLLSVAEMVNGNEVSPTLL